jgi:hypothetical protein
MMRDFLLPSCFEEEARGRKDQDETNALLYQCPGNWIGPPTNAKGTDVIANGHSSGHEKWPARAKRAVAIVATAKLSTSAAGFMTAASTPASAITAR